MSSTKTNVQSSIQISSEVETMINRMINVFLSSAYRCKWVAYYFERPQVGLFGLADIHRWSAMSEVMFARGLMEYMKLRGGRVELYEVPAPNQIEGEMEYLDVDEDGTCRFEKIESSSSNPKSDENKFVIEAFDCLILGKRAVYDYVLKLYKLAWDKYDPHLTDFLESNYIRPIANVNRKLGILKSQALLACSDESVGVYQFNKDVEKNLIKIMTVNKLVRPDKWSVTY